MDLPIVMREPGTAADRWRSIMIAVTCALVAEGMWLALPWLAKQRCLFVPGLPVSWFAEGYALVLSVLILVAAFAPIRALLDADRTWIVDADAITIQSRFIIGQHTSTWQLSLITKIRVREVRDDGLFYCVEIRLGRARWRGIRCYNDRHLAYEFKRLAEETMEMT